MDENSPESEETTGRPSDTQVLNEGSRVVPLRNEGDQQKGRNRVCEGTDVGESDDSSIRSSSGVQDDSENDETDNRNDFCKRRNTLVKG